MLRTTLTAAAFTVFALAAVPASAASMSCSGANLAKAESMVDMMADGPDRMAAFHEISAAQDDLLAGKMKSCAMHVGKVMKMGMMKPAGM